MIHIRRKPPTAKIQSERLKYSLLGNHTLEEKDCMALQVTAHLRHLGFTHVGPMDCYAPLLTPDFHPLTHFPDGTLIADHFITISDPYQSAADHYDLKYAPRPPKPF
jgi:hypothetical protein